MVNQVIGAINENFKKLFVKYPGAKIYGLAQSVVRVQGTIIETLPCVVDREGEGLYVGIDDTAPFILYHKINSVTGGQPVNKGGFGDESGDIIDIFNCSLVVYMDRKKANSAPDEVVFALQGSFPNHAQMQPFKNIRILYQGVILDTAQIYAREYDNPEVKGLDPGKTMLAINYQIEATFSRTCFSDCLF